MKTESSTNAGAVIEAIGELAGMTFDTITDPRGIIKEPVPFAAKPSGMEVESMKAILDEFLPHPERAEGTTELHDQEAFVAFVNRFESDVQSVVFANPAPAAPKLEAIFDFHAENGEKEGTPGFRKFRATLPLRLSDEWKAWMGINGKPTGQRDFAAFLEDRIGDVVLVNPDEDEKARELVELLGARVGGPSGLMLLARGLSVNVTSKVAQALTLESGEIAVKYEEFHDDGRGQPIKTPNMFFLAIPVFYGGDPYRIPARLRYRVENGSITWSVHLYRPDKAFDDAFKRVVKHVDDNVAAPVFLGTPKE